VRIAVYLPLLTGILLAVGAPWLARRLPPATATWLLVLAGTAVAASTTVTLALLAWAVIMESPVVAALGPWSAPAWDVNNPVPDSVAVSALVALVVVVGLLARTVIRLTRHSVRTRRALGDLGDGDDGDDGVVIVDHAGIEAFAVAYPGGRGRIVVSTGMLRALSPPERLALIAHEQAHLRHRHHLHRALAAAVCALNPILWPLGPAVDFATERWADEQAADEVGDRRLVARALARAALARRDAGERDHPVGLRYDRLDVPERVRRLLRPHPERGLLIIAPIVAVLILTLAAADHAREDTGLLLARAGRKPANLRCPLPPVR
jgi:hypothetical protein